MVDFMPFSRDLSQEQLIGYVSSLRWLESRELLYDRRTFVSPRGDTTNTNLQNMEPVSDTDQEQVPEDLGKLTEADKARTGRVRP